MSFFFACICIPLVEVAAMISSFVLVFFFYVPPIVSIVVPYPHPEWTSREEKEWENGWDRRRCRQNKDYPKLKVMQPTIECIMLKTCLPPFFFSLKFIVIVSLLPVYMKIYYQKNVLKPRFKIDVVIMII